MFKYIIIFIIFFIGIFPSHADRVENINERKIKKIARVTEKPIIKRQKVVNEIKSNFENKKQELIKEYKNKNISAKRAKEKLLKYKKSYIEEGKKKLKEERDKKNDEKLENLKIQVKKKIDLKLEKFSNFETDKRNEIYEKVLLKIDKALKNNNISKKQKLLYSILQEIFSDLVEK